MSDFTKDPLYNGGNPTAPTPREVRESHKHCCPTAYAALTRAEPIDVERVRAEYQRFYDFVADADPALVDAWHFTENARLARQEDADAK